MNAAEQQSIRNLANELLRSLWRKRSTIWTTPPDVDGLIPIPTDIIARSLLGVSLEEPEAITDEDVIPSHETAGFIDRSQNRIVIAQQFKPEYRRFTLAHEIAHWVLHPGEKYHRDRPLSGGERADGGRPQEEQAADLFAAELLMPRKILEREFNAAFGGRVDGRNSELAFWLSASGRQVSVTELQEKGLRYRSIALADLHSFRGKVFPSLAKRFGVSIIAGIQGS